MSLSNSDYYPDSSPASEEARLLLPVVRPIPFMSPDIDAPRMCAYARHASSAVRETEPLIRSHHPSLKESKVVFSLDGTEAAGRKIKVLSPVRDGFLWLSKDLDFYGWFFNIIDCGRILQLDELAEIRQFFTGAVTAVALSRRRIVVTFPTKEAIQACWVARVAEKVGQQIRLYDDEYNKDDIIFELKSRNDTGAIDRQKNRAVRLRFPAGGGIIVVVPEELLQNRNIVPLANGENIFTSFIHRFFRTT
ncbi:hypothetical protein BDDG_04018 [Blastomyces dermatitidis ATCC 18188]|uniref:Uncharacterized protein n=1 Tax=Ajellomyces dermatitidis (strain ATCC 18188 / CBS 674.68) TaxID=653446 RepID=F2TCW6_AJEDA|nr:hypothetical protein BDDG_04018 [Blastomyces dermatitidis ATCC 18188]